VSPTVEALSIPPFKEIWERDNSSKKEVALQEFAYIEFMASKKKSNPYKGYPEDRRETAVRKDVIVKKEWAPDKLVSKGIQRVVDFQTDASPTYALYMSAKKAVENLRGFLDTVDVTEKNERTGNPIYKPVDITKAVTEIERLLNTMSNLEKKVEEELFEETRMRSNKEIGFFAKMDSFK